MTWRVSIIGGLVMLADSFWEWRCNDYERWCNDSQTDAGSTSSGKDGTSMVKSCCNRIQIMFYYSTQYLFVRG